MKKNFKFTYTFLVLTCGMLICSLFSSCDNFLRTGDVREKMIAAREFEEAKTCKVLIKADAEKGDFLSAGEKNLKVGYDTQIQFTVKKKDYVFKGFEAVNVNNPEQSLAKYVTFTPVSQNEEYGIYKYNVKLLDSVSNLLIRPVCVARPKIEQITPELESSGCEQNTPIQITFNKPVNPQSFGDFSCIQIFANDNLAEYFETPVFSSDNKTLYIAVNPDKQIIPPNGPKTTLDIEVIYDFTQALDEDGVTLTEQGSYTYKINNDMSAQKKVVVMVKSVAEEGEFNSSVEKECIVGYAFDLVFTLNKDKYSFAGFEAVSSSDNVTSRADCVSFEEQDYNEETGVYTVSVRILTEQEDILIRPVCKLRPYVQSISPAGSEVQTSNTFIMLTFNTQMEAPETAQNQSLFNYDNIILSYTDSHHVNHDMSEYFELPVFDSQKKILTIEPKALALKNFIKGKNAAYIDLNISFNKIFNLQNSNFTVRYGSVVETTAPEKINFFVTAKPISLQDENRLEEFPKFCTDDFNLITEQYNARPQLLEKPEYAKKILSNRVKDCIYIYGKYLDAESGVKKVIVTQDGFDPREYVAGDDDAEFFTDKNNYTSFCIKYNLLAVDDVYNFWVSVSDACNNTAPTEFFFAVSKTHYNALAGRELDFGRDGNDMYLNISNQPSEITDQLQPSSYPWTIDFDEYKSHLTHFRIYPDTVKLLVYDNISYYSNSDFSFYCKYIDKDGIERNEKFNDYDEEKGYWALDLNLDTITGVGFTFKLVDELGAEGEFEISSDATMRLTEKIDWQHKVNYSISYDLAKDYTYFLIRNSNTGILNYKRELASHSMSLGNNEELEGFIYHLRNGLYSDYFPVQIPENYVTVTDTQILADVNAHTISVKFTFADDTWDTYDQIDLTVKAGDTDWDKETIYNNSGNLEYIYTFKKVYDSESGESIFNVLHNPPDHSDEPSMQFIFTGKNQLIIKTGEPEYVNLSEYNKEEYKGKFDNEPPELSFRMNLDNCIFELLDGEAGSGPKGGTITLGTQTYTIEKKEGNHYRTSIPVQVIMNSLDISNSSVYYAVYDYEVYDNNDNCAKGSDSIVFYPSDNDDCVAWARSDGTIYCYEGNQYGSGTITYDGAKAYMYDPDEDEWILYGEGFESNKKDIHMLDNWSAQTMTDKFVKINILYSRQILFPVYVYTGSNERTEKYDIFIPAGDSKTSMFISSDAPVFVQVITSSKDSEICKNWDPSRWCYFGDTVQRTIIPFSYTDHDPRLFHIDDEVYNNIPEGAFYTIVLVYGDNDDNITMSKVMQK